MVYGIGIGFATFCGLEFCDLESPWFFHSLKWYIKTLWNHYSTLTSPGRKCSSRSQTWCKEEGIESRPGQCPFAQLVLQWLAWAFMTGVDIDVIKFLQVIFLLLALEIISTCRTCFSSRSRSPISMNLPAPRKIIRSPSAEYLTSPLNGPKYVFFNPLHPPWFRLGVFNIRGKGRDY